MGHDSHKISELYSKKAEGEEDSRTEAAGEKLGEDKKNAYINFHFTDDADIKMEPDSQPDPGIEKVFGRKVALAMHAIDWKFKEIALKVIFKVTEKNLNGTSTEEEAMNIDELISACVTAISLTCKEKVIKVFSVSL